MKVQVYEVTLREVEFTMPSHCPSCGNELGNYSHIPSFWGNSLIRHGISGVGQYGQLAWSGEPEMSDDGGYPYVVEHGNGCGHVLFDGLKWVEELPT